MTTYPWRFQADLTPGVINPDVTVFIGDLMTNNATGEQTLARTVNDPVVVKLADLSEFIITGMTNGVTREKPPEPT